MTAPADWATNKAIDLIAYAARFPYAQAVELIALELRAVRLQGETAGIKEASQVAA